MPSTLCGDLRAAQDETDLRAIAMTDGHIPAGFDHVGDVVGGFLGGQVLVFNSLVVLVLDQGIAANSDNCDFLFAH